MALDLKQFVKNLEDSGLVAPGKLENFVPPKAFPKDAQELAQELIKQKHLTGFQAREIYRGRAKSLILGNYTILDKIGAGGMGQVFKAEHRRMHRIVAIKMLPPRTTKSATAIARFQREVEAAAKLSHPNVVAAYDADEANGVHFLVMEYVKGSDLSALVKKNGPFSVANAVDYILQAARGLDYAHKQGVIHRDIKPANLLLNVEGTVKILDMGLARIESSGEASTQADLTGTGTVLGSVHYMSPEQALSTHHADVRADVYSLGCSLYYLLTGKPPYDGQTLMARALADREQPIPSPRDVQADVPEPLEAVFRKMVAKTVEHRYQSMKEVIADLEACRLGILPAAASAQVPAGVMVDDDSLAFLADASTLTGERTATKRAPFVGPGKPSNKILGLIGAGVLGSLILLAAAVVKFSPAPGGQQPIAAKLIPREDKVKAAASGPWLKHVASLPAQQQVEAVVLKLRELNPGFDGKETHVIENDVVTKLWILTDDVADVSPLRALPGLKVLTCSGSDPRKGLCSDLSPLEDMKLTEFVCSNTQVADLSPLKDMKLTYLDCVNTRVADLSPLKGMPFKNIEIRNTQVADLSPLKGMKLTYLYCNNTRVADLSPLKGMKLTELRCYATQVSDLSPLQGMPLDSLSCDATHVADLSPLKDMKLTELHCGGTQVTDLSPLKELQLTRLWIEGTQVADLSPLKDMKLTELRCYATQVSDLSPLRGMKLTFLYCDYTQVSDLSPLKGMPLTTLYCRHTQVSDLSPLKGMPLTDLHCDNTPVSDLSPLTGMHLTQLNVNDTQVIDLSPLKGMRLQELRGNFFLEEHFQILRSIKTLEEINEQPAAKFWKDVEYASQVEPDRR